MCLTQSRSRTGRRGRSRSSEQSRTGRRRSGRWSGRRSDTSSSPSCQRDPPTPVPPPSWPRTPADLRTHTKKHDVPKMCPLQFNIHSLHTHWMSLKHTVLPLHHYLCTCIHANTEASPGGTTVVNVKRRKYGHALHKGALFTLV